MSAALSSPHSWEDMESLVLWCRSAAALQPDGTRAPAVRCEVGTPPALPAPDARCTSSACPQDIHCCQQTVQHRSHSSFLATGKQLDRRVRVRFL